MSTIYSADDSTAIRLLARAAHLQALTAVLACGGEASTPDAAGVRESLLELTQELAGEVSALAREVVRGAPAA